MQARDVPARAQADALACSCAVALAQSMTICGYTPEVVGLEHLEGVGHCLYVPNHASFLDILTLTGFVPRPMKYVSEAKILEIPLIGWPMRLAGHVALKRGNRRSQLETFKDTVASLEKGNSLITFAEGGRSVSGKLMPFKRGEAKPRNPRHFDGILGFSLSGASCELLGYSCSIVIESY